MVVKLRGGPPHPVDIHVGQRMRALRRAAGLSLDALSVQVGVAYQQLQKYERGANRISASSLYEVARALGHPVSAFFDGLPGLQPPAGDPPPDAAGEAGLARLLAALPPAQREALRQITEGLARPDRPSTALSGPEPDGGDPASDAGAPHDVESSGTGQDRLAWRRSSV